MSRRSRGGPIAAFACSKGGPGVRTLWIAAAAMVALLAAVPELPGAPAGSAPFRLLPSEPNTIRFEITIPGDVTVERGNDVLRIDVAGLPSTELPIPEAAPAADVAIEGPAVLPEATTWIALPPGAEARVGLEVVETEDLDRTEGLRPASLDRIISALEESAAARPAPGWLRNQWALPLRFRPVIADDDGRLRLIRRAVVTVRHDGGAPDLRSRPATGRDPFENLYRGLFLNYDDGRRWRRGETARPEPLRQTDFFSSSPNPWVRVQVPRQAIYGIRALDLGVLLAGDGIPLGDVDPLTLRLFRPQPLPLAEDARWDEAPAWMLEVPILIEGGEDGILDPDDRIVFLGQGPDGWFLDLGVLPFSMSDRYHRDPFANEIIYWLTWGGEFTGDPRRIPVVDASDVFPTGVDRVEDRIRFEEDRVWDPRQREEGAGAVTWERFWWHSLSVNANDTEQRIRVVVPDPVSGTPVRVRTRLWGNYWDGETRWPDHAIRVRLNGTLIVETDRLPDGSPWNRLDRLDIDTTGVWLAASEPEQEFGFVPPYHPLEYPEFTRVDQVYLAWIELDYTRSLIAQGDSLSFFAGGWSGSQTLQMTGFDEDEIIILDATDPYSPRQLVPDVSSDGGTRVVRFRAELGFEPPSRFLARGTASLPRPRMKIDRAPSDGYLRERFDPVDMIIITHEDFLEAAEELAAHRRLTMPDRETGRVAVVDIQDVLDEFSFGRMDPTAVRNFLQFASENWNGGDPESSPAYVVLLGDAHYDFRDLLGRGANLFVPTYEGYWDPRLAFSIYSPQFASDDFFGYLDGPNDIALDLYIGRLPVSSALLAGTTVGKILSYEDPSTLGPWRGRVTLVADDICQGTRPDVLGFTHMRQTEALVPLLPSESQMDRVYLYEYGAECVYDRKPAAAEALQSRMNEGTLLVNYTGHGSEVQIADERVFETAMVPSLRNADRLFLFLTASCSVGKYDYFGVGLGEAMLLLPTGGAISVFSASAVAFSVGNAAVNQNFFEAAFPGRIPGASRPTGEAAALAKARLSDPSSINSRRFVLLGDPATRLAAPRLPVELALSDARTGAPLGRELRRGMLTDLSGRVLNENGEPATGFNGRAHVRVYDSSILREPDPQVPYELTGAAVHRGEAEVSGGEFTLRFQVPSALRTGDRGPARIFVYVEDGTVDGSGVLDSLFVPEIEERNLDTEGPQIEVVFEDDPASLPPGATFTATFHDTSGVNITGLVGSRSVLVQVEEEGQLISVEDVADRVEFGDDYATATLHHQLPEGITSNRSYELVVKASDNMRNGGSARVPFRLLGSGAGGFTLARVYNFPNPTDGPTRFFGSLGGDAVVRIQLFTISGRRIWETEARVTAGDFSREGIPWDGRDADGDRPGNGVYPYKITATPLSGGPPKETLGRLVVAR